MNNENKKIAYIKTIEKLCNSKISCCHLYKRYQVIMKQNGEIIGRSNILSSKKKATEILEATQKRWVRMEQRRQENE